MVTSPGAGLNRRPRPYQGRALPAELPGHLVQFSSLRIARFLSSSPPSVNREIQYPSRQYYLERETGLEPATPSLEGSRSSQLSYSRPIYFFKFHHGEGRIRTSEGKRRQIYSLLPLAARAPLHTRTHDCHHQRKLAIGLEPTTY